MRRQFHREARPGVDFRPPDGNRFGRREAVESRQRVAVDGLHLSLGRDRRAASNDADGGHPQGSEPCLDLPLAVGAVRASAERHRPADG